jgi:TetR/AcrR family transcriptional regulator, transcriptional repressor of aconitase
MPRVSQEHLDARRRQILDAARRSFVRNGFHATSMQEVLREADLSAGAVYRYFKSKDEIIGAIAANALATITSAVDEVLDTETPPPLDEALAAVLETVERLDHEQDTAKVALQVWGEALRSPALAARVEETIAGVTASLTRLVEAYQERGQIAADVPPDEVARLLVAIVHGFVVRHAVLGDVDVQAFRRGLQALVAGHDRSIATT